MLKSWPTILYFLSIYGLEKLGSSTVWRAGYRGIFADYAYVVSFTSVKDPDVSHLLRVQISTIFWVGFSHIPGNLKSTHISFVPITRAFYPTQPRGWLVQFWELDTKWIFAALPFGFLTMLLFYYDHVSKHRA